MYVILHVEYLILYVKRLAWVKSHRDIWWNVRSSSIGALKQQVEIKGHDLGGFCIPSSFCPCGHHPMTVKDEFLPRVQTLLVQIPTLTLFPPSALSMPPDHDLTIIPAVVLSVYTVLWVYSWSIQINGELVEPFWGKCQHVVDHSTNSSTLYAPTCRLLFEAFGGWYWRKRFSWLNTCKVATHRRTVAGVHPSGKFLAGTPTLYDRTVELRVGEMQMVDEMPGGGSMLVCHKNMRTFIGCVFKMIGRFQTARHSCTSLL